MEEIIFISGLPRSGSTLLSAILSENPNIHTEGNSPLCQLIKDIDYSITHNCNEQIGANNKNDIVINLIKEIPNMYYKNRNENVKIILDKCRTWTLEENIKLLEKYITSNPKIIILYRNITEIINSFVKIYVKNKKGIDIERWLDEGTDPLMLPLDGLLQVKNNNKYLLIDYEELINSPNDTLKKIYEYIEIEYYEHDLSNIKMKNPENDNIYGLEDLHNVYSTIKTEKDKITIPKKVIKKCEQLNKLLFSQ